MEDRKGTWMRRLTIVIAAATAAMALLTGVALANSVTFTLRGTLSVHSRGGDAWYLRNSAGQVAGTAAFFCLQPNSQCAWDFRFRTGSFGIKVRHRETRSRVGLTATILSPTGGYAGDKGSVHVYFRTPKAARFTFHLNS
jgi:hypothetical protein